MQSILHTAKAGHWKDCNGLERRRDECADAIEKIVSECKSQKTYKPRPEDEKGGEPKEREMAQAVCLYFICHKSDGLTFIFFFIT